MTNNRNVLYLIIGVLAVALSVVSYNLYQAKKEPVRSADQCRPERAEDPEQ